MIFLEEKRIRATFEWIRACFIHLGFKKDAVPGLRIETRIRTEVRIRASALPATDYGPGICIRDRILYRTVRIRI